MPIDPAILTNEVKFRFLSKVAIPYEDGCWIWQASKDSHGYGQFSLNGKGKAAEKAHRVSWAIHRKLSPEGYDICHTCDTPACVNPAHLFRGTAKDNLSDCSRKGRTGRRNNRIIEEKDFPKLLAMRKAGCTQKQAAEFFGVKRAAISKIEIRLKNRICLI